MTRILPLPTLLVALLAGCAAAPVAPRSHFSSATLTVVDGLIQPDADAVIPTFGTVVWRNGAPAGGADLEVVVDRSFAPSAPCSTSLHFVGTGDQARSLAVPPQGIASLCFHDAGTFRYVVHTGGRELRGTIRVGGQP